MEYINRIFNEDCLSGMYRYPDKSIDMILCDLPYGVTGCRWDSLIPLDELWRQYKHVIKDRGAKMLGKENPLTATTYNNIAGVYDSQGDYTKALERYQKALYIIEKMLGKEHPSTATTYNNIAGVLSPERLLTGRGAGGICESPTQGSQDSKRKLGTRPA